MTVSANNPRLSYNGDAVSVAFTSPYFLANADLKVYVGGVLKTLTTDYSVSGAGVASGGTVTFVSAPAVGTGNVVILRDPDLLQQTKYPNNDPFPAAAHETALDKLTMIVQRLKDLLSRSFTLGDSDTSGASLTVPTPSALKFLRWNSGATALEAVDIAMQGAVALPLAVNQGGTNSTTAANARAALGTDAATQKQTDIAFTTTSTKPAADRLYVLTPTPAITANAADICFWATFDAAAAGAPTLAVSGKAALPLVYLDSTGTEQAVTATQAPAGWKGRVACNAGATKWVLRDVPPVSSSGGKVQDFRLTLTSATPVTTADVTGATTIYCTPYKGNQIALYDGSSTWNTRTSAEFSLALGTLTAAKPYDVFCYDNAGTPTLEFLAWTNDTTRATALVYQDGVLVKSGATTRRYLGTFYTTSTTQTEDSVTNRYLWNCYNRVLRPMSKTDSTASWTYTTATWRQANAAAANQLNVVVGVAEDAVRANVMSEFSNTGANGGATGIGIDSTSSNSARSVFSGGNVGSETCFSATYSGVLSAGRHYLAWLEIAQAGGTATWRGSTTLVGVNTNPGISAEVMA